MMIKELRVSCKLYCENVLMSLRDLVPKIIGQYYLNTLKDSLQIEINDHINHQVKENPDLVKLTEGQKSEKNDLQRKLKIMIGLKQYMVQDGNLYQFLRDPTLEANIFNRYQKMKNVYFKKLEENQRRRDNAVYKKKTSKVVKKKKKGNIFRRFGDWIKGKSKKKKKSKFGATTADQQSMMNPRMKDMREDFRPEDFAIKRPRANSLDTSKKTEKQTQELISDFVIIEDYAESLGTGLSEKEWMIAVSNGTFEGIE